MTDVLLSEEVFIDASPASVFSLIADDAAGWSFDTEGRGLAPGRLAHFAFTLPTTLGGKTFEATGRILTVVPARSIVIAHEMPWRGKITFSLVPTTGGGTRVRIVAHLEARALEWFLSKAGVEPTDEVETSHLVGLLVSHSGPASIFAGASENVARLAVEEVNSDGGVGGNPISLVLGDDESDPATGARELARLIRRGCRALVTNVTSATFRAIEPLSQRAGILLIHTPVNEGGTPRPHVLRLGERPAGQLKNSVPFLMRSTSSRRWYLAGNDYSWPRATNATARAIIEMRGGVVVGERYEPLGTRDFGPLVDDIWKSRAELIVSTFIGADEVAFERQCLDARLRDRCRTLALDLDEATREHIGDAAANGLWTAFGYFKSLRSEVNSAFLRRYACRFGCVAPPVSSTSESLYEAVHLYAAAAREVEDGDPRETRMRLHGRVFDGPRGHVSVGESGRLDQPMYLAEAVPGGLAVRERFG